MRKLHGLKIVLIILVLMPLTLAVDLPIDIETLTRQDDEQRGSLTVRWRIDLFSESSDMLKEAIANQREQNYLDAKSSLFTEPHIFTIHDIDETLLTLSTEAHLFSEPMQRRQFVNGQEETSLSPVIIIIVFTIAIVSGLIFAFNKKANRKERTANVHNHNY